MAKQSTDKKKSSASSKDKGTPAFSYKQESIPFDRMSIGGIGPVSFSGEDQEVSGTIYKAADQAVLQAIYDKGYEFSKFINCPDDYQAPWMK